MKVYRDAQEMRTRADYDMMSSLSAEEAGDMLEAVGAFVTEDENLLTKEGPEG